MRELWLRGEWGAQGTLSPAPPQPGGCSGEQGAKVGPPACSQQTAPYHTLPFLAPSLAGELAHGDLGCELPASSSAGAVTAPQGWPRTPRWHAVSWWARDPIQLKNNLGTWWEMVGLKPNGLCNLVSCAAMQTAIMGCGRRWRGTT